MMEKNCLKLVIKTLASTASFTYKLVNSSQFVLTFNMVSVNKIPGIV